MTHEDLIQRAGRWLLSTKRCKVVLTHVQPHGCDEHPDAIGWLTTGESILIECKATVADFQGDWRKQWRRYSGGMGFWRYYMTPAGMLVGTIHGTIRGCGLLEVHGKKVIVRIEAEPRQDREWAEEIRLLLARADGQRTVVDNGEYAVTDAADEGAARPTE